MACSMRPPACHLMPCLCDGVPPSALLLTSTQTALWSTTLSLPGSLHSDSFLFFSSGLIACLVLVSPSNRNTAFLCRSPSLPTFRKRSISRRRCRQQRQRLPVKVLRALLQTNKHGARCQHKQLAQPRKGTSYLTRSPRKQIYGGSEPRSSG